MDWLNDHRPGYFGRSRDAKIAHLNEMFGKGGWRLAWVTTLDDPCEFFEACVKYYEQSYFVYLKDRPDDLKFICSHGECIDNAPSNVKSGCNYQESYSTHIQDIAVRRRLELKFEGPADKILVIRSADSNGYKFGPGNIPFVWPHLITSPSLCPKWAKRGSVEDFWQSNKWVQIGKP